MNIKKQISRLYLYEVISGLQIVDTVWVFFLLQRGFSLAQVGIAEGVFHIVSMCFEIPSGMVSDTIGRRRTLMLAGMVSAFRGASPSDRKETSGKRKRAYHQTVFHRHTCLFKHCPALPADCFPERDPGFFFPDLCNNPGNLLQAANFPVSPCQRDHPGYPAFSRIQLWGKGIPPGK